MSCYLRHLKPMLIELDIEPRNKEERKLIDLTLRSAVGMDAGDKCNEVWKVVKAWLKDEDKKQVLAGKMKGAIDQ